MWFPESRASYRLNAWSGEVCSDETLAKSYMYR